MRVSVVLAAARFAGCRAGVGAANAILPTPLGRAPWAIPLLHHSALTMVATGTKIRSSPAMITATVAASVAQAMVAGLVLYWAGRRFGERLAEMAEQSKSIWKS